MSVGNKWSIGTSPLSYMGTSAGAPPNVSVHTRAPTSSDIRNVKIGDIWVYLDRDVAPYVAYVFMLTSLAQNRAAWIGLTPQYVAVAMSPASMLAQGNYVTTAAGIVYVLPETAPFGATLSVLSLDGTSRIEQRDGQRVMIGDQATTIGTAGYVESTALRDSLTLVCVESNKTWAATSMIGNWLII